MARVGIDEVQLFLEPSKLSITIDDDLAEADLYEATVLGKFEGCGVDTSTWLDEASTPKLVRYIIAMLIAAHKYNTAYSETDEAAGNPYANKLEERAHMLQEGICSGSIDLAEVSDDPLSQGVGQPSFYPTDTTGAADEEEAARFTIGKKF